MNKAEWFACLDYDNFDILLPHKQVSDTGLTSSYDQELLEWMNRYDLDKVLSLILKQNISQKSCTEIAIESTNHDIEQIVVSTSKVPSIVLINLKEIKPVQGLIKDKMLNYGIMAFRFIDKKIQYVIDLETFFLNYKGEL